MLGKTSEYAIRALVYIHLQNQEGKRPGFKEISKNIDSPEQFTAKILQSLSRMEFIASMKGRGGGFFFTDTASPLTLYDVIRLFEGEKFFSRCVLGLKSCDKDHPCPLHDDYIGIRDRFEKLASKQTIKSLANKIKNENAVLKRK